MTLTRRRFLQTGLTLAAAGVTGMPAEPRRKRIASINSLYYKLSHAYHIAGRFLYGFTLHGQPYKPSCDVVRMYNHQYHKEGRFADLSRDLAPKKGFTISDTIADALGGPNRLDVDAVLLICEHGDYPRNKLGQILYPRYEFFEQIVEVFQKSGRSVPVFCDKHLSYDHEKAGRMYETARKMKFGLMAGSSLPVTWRKPEWDLTWGSEVEEAVVCYFGDMDIWGFHALESLQCVLERRKGGETGVRSITTLKGESFWKAYHAGRWSRKLMEAALRQSMSRDYGKPEDHVAEPIAFLIEYSDGTRASVLNLTGYVSDLTLAVKLKRDPAPQAVQFVLPSPPGARFFDPLCWYIDQFFLSGKPSYPVERTWLTSTLLDFAHRSAGEGGQTLQHEAMKIGYQPEKDSLFFHGSISDD